MTELLQIDGLSFTVAGRAILDSVDLALEAGEIHVLLGANGTGKTTLANLVMGCSGYQPTAGTIRFRGRPIDGLPIHERARLGITLTWQEPARFEGLKVRDYLTLGEDPGDPAAWLERVGLAADAYLDRAVDKTLSGGERKRIELASALALRPRLAILDEPGAGIDLLSIDEIVGLIRDLRRPDAAVLLITHQQELAQVADRASYLCGGRILATGKPERIAEAYRRRPCKVCDGEVCRG